MITELPWFLHSFSTPSFNQVTTVLYVTSLVVYANVGFAGNLMNVVYIDLIRPRGSQYERCSDPSPPATSSLMCLLCWINFTTSTHINLRVIRSPTG